MTAPRNRSAKTGPHHEALVEEATAWLVRMTSDLITEADRRAFRTWLDCDPAHRQAYAEVEALWDEIRAIPDPRLGFGIEGRATDERFTGVFELGDTDRALAAIEATLPVDVMRVTPWLALLRARE